MTDVKITPLNTYIVVEIDKVDEVVTAGGIYMPTNLTASANNILTNGKVVTVNSKCTEIHVGDIVMFNKHALKDIPSQESLKLVREEDIYAVM